MTKFLVTMFAAAAILAPGYAESAQHDKMPADSAEGEVRKVDRDAKKITLRHGPIPNLDMPAHTMVFQVADSAMLDQVKVGDKVRFQAEKRGGAFTLNKIEVAR